MSKTQNKPTAPAVPTDKTGNPIWKPGVVITEKNITKALTAFDQGTLQGRMDPTSGDFIPLANDFAIEFKLDKTVAGEFVARGSQLINQHAALGKSYMELCTFIRSKSISPVQVTGMMKALGFAKTRIAEVNKVSQVTDEMWDAMTARALGFKNALDVARGNVVLAAIDAPKEEMEKAGLVGDEPTNDTHPAGETDQTAKTDYSLNIQKGAKTMLVAAQKAVEAKGNKTLKKQLRDGKKFFIGNDFLVTIKHLTDVEKIELQKETNANVKARE